MTTPQESFNISLSRQRLTNALNGLNKDQLLQLMKQKDLEQSHWTFETCTSSFSQKMRRAPNMEPSKTFKMYDQFKYILIESQQRSSQYVLFMHDISSYFIVGIIQCTV